VLLHTNVSCVALHEKGDENDEGRVSEASSSCQSNNKPGPGGTWACQRCRLCDYSTQTGKVSCSGCQT